MCSATPATRPPIIDWFVPHQANKRIIDGSAHKLGIAPEKVVTTVDRHGNTSAASIPLALDVAIKDGRIKRGDLVLAGGDGRRIHLGRGTGALVRHFAGIAHRVTVDHCLDM